MIKREKKTGATLQEEKKELKNGITQGKKIYSLQETKILFLFFQLSSLHLCF